MKKICALFIALGAVIAAAGGALIFVKLIVSKKA